MQTQTTEHILNFLEKLVRNGEKELSFITARGGDAKLRVDHFTNLPGRIPRIKSWWWQYKLTALDRDHKELSERLDTIREIYSETKKGPDALTYEFLELSQAELHGLLQGQAANNAALYTYGQEYMWRQYLDELDELL